MESIAVFPGTFDPITNGHLDLIKRATLIFDKIIVAVAASPSKHTMFDLKTRVNMCKESIKDFNNVTVEGFDGMLIDYLNRKHSSILLRGVRSGLDFEYESQLSNMYKVENPDIEMVILTPNPAVSFISSTLVREVIIHHGSIEKYVPKAVVNKVKEL